VELGTGIAALWLSGVVLAGLATGKTDVAEISIPSEGAASGRAPWVVGAAGWIDRSGIRMPIMTPSAPHDRTIATAVDAETGKRPRAADQRLARCRLIPFCPLIDQKE
jgi:hypothetical protein